MSKWLPILVLGLLSLVLLGLPTVNQGPTTGGMGDHNPILHPHIYFVDATSGSDSNSGLGFDSPWQTIAKVNAATLVPGNTVYFKRGETWEETLTVPSSGSIGLPITFAAYGAGADPILSGSDTMTGFVAVTGGSLLSDNFDDGNMTEWGGTGAKPTATNAAARNGTHGMEVNNTGWSLANQDWGATSQDIYISLSFKPDNIVAVGTKSEYILRLDENGGSTQLVRMEFRYAAGTLSVSARFMKNQALTPNVWETIDSGWHTLELYFESDNAAGRYYFKVDGVVVNSETGIDTGDGANPYDIDYIYLGKSGAEAWTTFNAFYDDLEINDADSPTAHYAKAAVTTEPNLVFEDSVPLTLGSSASTLATGEWFWGADVLTIRSTDDLDPDTHTIEAGQRDHAVSIDNLDYLIFSGLDIRYTNDTGVEIANVTDDSSNITFTDCTMQWNYNDGVLVSTDNKTTDLVFDNCEFSNNARTRNGTLLKAQLRIADNGGANTGTISNSTVYNDSIYDNDEWYVDGIRIGSGSFTIESNELYNNDHAIRISSYHAGSTIIRYNEVHDNRDDGIWTELWTATQGAGTQEIYYNSVYDNGDDGLDIRSNSEVYNNTVHGNSDAGLVIQDWVTNNVNVSLKNNIFSENGQADYETDTGVYESYVYHDNNNILLTSDYNDFYHSGGGTFMHWKDGSDYNFADWKTNSGGDANSNSADPTFTAVGTDDFTLQPGSPAINTGVDVGLTTDILGNPIVGLPDMGCYEVQ